MWRLMLLFFVLLGVLLPAAPARAILTIEITQGAEGGLPVAIVPFQWKGPGALPVKVSTVVAADLKRSGRISPLPEDKLLSQPHRERDVVFKDWRLIKAEALVIGVVAPVGANRYRIEFRLFDVFKEKQLAGYRYTVKANRLRAVAHQISDVIYEKLTGESGAFNTRIAYISREGTVQRPVYKLQVSDSDGYNAKTIVTSSEPMMSPAWSPDGKSLAYVSFEQKRSVIYVQHLLPGTRQRIAAFKGINSAPAWSPDGRRLAITLSRDGNAEIYLYELAGKQLRRLTRHGAIDTEPAWSPDGRAIVFTSDRAGRPQIYRMPVAGGRIERLTFEGSYNARASYSPDGKYLTLVNGRGGRFHIAVLRLRDRMLQVLTDTRLDESPTFAPNGRMVLYATQQRGRGVLASVSADGRVRQLFTLEGGDVREPAWSPHNR